METMKIHIIDKDALKHQNAVDSNEGQLCSQIGQVSSQETKLQFGGHKGSENEQNG